MRVPHGGIKSRGLHTVTVAYSRVAGQGADRDIEDDLTESFGVNDSSTVPSSFPCTFDLCDCASLLDATPCKRVLFIPQPLLLCDG